MKAIVVIVIVVAVLVGGLLSLRSTRNTGLPDAATIARAKLREREQAAKDKDDARTDG